MSSKDKSKLKMFLRTKNTQGERSLRPETEKELRPEQPAAQRCKILSELQLHNLNLEEASITKLWDITKDLIVPNKPAEYRQTTLNFYKKLIHSQYKNLTIMREHFFLVVQSHEVHEDLRHRIELLDTLTENGKDINYFEERVGSFMLNWLPAITEANLLRPYLDMLVNLIKFNAAHLDNDVVVGIVQNACHLCCTVEDNEIGLQCLTILEMVMGYTIFPSDPLPQCIETLCRTVNHVPYCQPSWKIMKNLIGTQLGYESMKMMCNILTDRSLYEDQQLLRGAVFHLNMSVFNSKVIFHVSPMFYASTVLTSFLHALDSRQVIVTFEVILSARMVITKYKTELPEIIWDRLCDIMCAIVDNIDYYEMMDISVERLNDLKSNFHENIDCIEQLLLDDKSELLANLDRIYDLIERVSEERPEASVLNLIEYRSSKVTATRPQWLQVLNEFVQRFYKLHNVNIRARTIQSLMRIMELNRSSYEEEILERVVLPHFVHIVHEPQVQVRVAVARALIDFVRHCDTKRCMELLDVLEKLINRPFEQHSGSGGDSEASVKTEDDVLDVITAVDGLIEVFAVKLYRLPSSHAIKIFNILIGHLELHYERPNIFEPACIVRYKIFQWMLKARANASYHLGYPDPENNDAIKFSYYLDIDSTLPLTYGTAAHTGVRGGAHETPSAGHCTTISIRRACKMIVKCLETDREYQIFQLVLRELPKVLHNKALIQGNDIESLASTLFKIYSKTNKGAQLSYEPTTDEFNALLLPAIASLVIYHQHIHPNHQLPIISYLTVGFFSGIANVCINTMTTMILEMPETLMRTLPDILLQMSKMSDTTAVAIPVLEFLSILSRLSNHLFTNFIPRQYMYVFAISLPYTKPYRYDHYVVSLAHHVIAGWFLKCKLELRRNFVPYIITYIHSNTSTLCEDINTLTRNVQRTDFNYLNEDSSNRKRSTSLTERGSRNANPAGSRNDSEMRPLMNDSLKSFHTELADTCVDFLVRHTFSPCSAMPKRLPAVEYLLKDGLSQTWLVGYNLITITTSGCPSAPTRNGLCERCAQLSKSPAGKGDTSVPLSTAGPLSPDISSGGQSTANLEKRYTKVSLQHSSGNESAGSTDLTSSSSGTSGSHVTQRQTSNSSSASLEALSRRGSNPETADIGIVSGASGAGSGIGSTTSLLGNSLSTTSVSLSPTQMQPTTVQQQTCIRSCTGWAEILIRRPTGNISWITRIQNPIANDCFGQDIPFSDVVSLFLPTAHGGVFGPDFLQPTTTTTNTNTTLLEDEVDQMETNIANLPSDVEASVSKPVYAGPNVSDSHESLVEQRRHNTTKNRPLQRQEEITSASAVSTAAIDIPKAMVKRGKEALSGSVSDGEADDGNTAFEDGRNRTRTPVRRVNSSPEMSSSWRNAFLASKPAPLSQDMVHRLDQATTIGDTATQQQQPQQQQQQQQFYHHHQKKKSVQYTKEMRVSCEAIPEEIAGSTPPQSNHNEKSEKVAETSTAVAAAAASSSATHESSTALPPKQHSADDVSNTSTALPVQQSASASSLKTNVTTKPPLSPAPPLSPRLDKHTQQKTTSFSSSHQGLAKSSSSGGGTGGGTTNPPIGGTAANSLSIGNAGDYNNGDVMRGRSKTISVVREVNGKTRTTASSFRGFGATKPAANVKLCMHPSFVFLQLYNTGDLKVTEEPIKVPPEQMNVITLLDLLPPFETHKIGVLYVGQGQCNNVVEILRNSHGSTRYVEFLRSIGTLVSLKDADQNNLFVALDKFGADGKFMYMWKDDIVQVTFHVATLMPTNLQKDPLCNEKKKHIGNDYVNIIYNESGEEYNLNTISGQFSYACVIVEPLELNTNRVFVKARPEIAKYICHPEPKIVSDRSAPLLARQLALHANLASHVYQSLQKKHPYASNWLERLRQIKRLRTKLVENLSKQQNQSGSGADLDDHSADPLRKQHTNRDFTKYT